MRNVNKRSRIRVWRWRRAGWWWRIELIRNTKSRRKFVPQVRCDILEKRRFVILRLESTGGWRRVTKLLIGLFNICLIFSDVNWTVSCVNSSKMIKTDAQCEALTWICSLLTWLLTAFPTTEISEHWRIVSAYWLSPQRLRPESLIVEM